MAEASEAESIHLARNQADLDPVASEIGTGIGRAVVHGLVYKVVPVWVVVEVHWLQDPQLSHEVTVASEVVWVMLVMVAVSITVEVEPRFAHQLGRWR